ncbi:MAG TPA: hypothetical protein PLV45_04990 [bacterium]|nr:hypothetical protein [bacterium]
MNGQWLQAAALLTMLLICASGCTHLDTGHRATCEKLIDLSQNLDDFFGDPHADEDYNRTRWRVGGGAELTEDDTVEFTGTNSLKIDLPATKERWGVLIGGATERSESYDVTTGEQTSPISPEDSGDDETERITESYIRFYSKMQTPLKWDFDLGLKYSSDWKGFVRLRGKRNGYIGRSKYYFAQQFFWRNTDEGFGSKTQFDLDQRMDECALIREFLEIQYHEDSSGLDVYTGLKMRMWAGNRMGVSLEWINFMTSHPWQYRYSEFVARFRRSIGRPWFEIEVTPRLKMKRKDGLWEQLTSVEVIFAFVFDAKHILDDEDSE